MHQLKRHCFIAAKFGEAEEVAHFHYIGRAHVHVSGSAPIVASGVLWTASDDILEQLPVDQA